MGIINFAHGEFLMMGAYATYVLQQLVPAGADGAAFLAALPLAFVLTALVGLLLEKSLNRHLYGRPYEGMLATWGLSLILQQAARSLFGANNVAVRSPEWLRGGIELTRGLQLPCNRLFILAVAVLAIVGMVLYVNRSPRGRLMRAVMQNRDMAGCMGIKTRRVDSTTFAIGCGLAGIAGSVVSLLGSIGPSTGQNYIIDTRAAPTASPISRISSASRFPIRRP